MVRPKFDEAGNKTALSALAKTAVHPSDCIKLYSNRYPCINPFFLLKVLLFLLLLVLLLLLLFVPIVGFASVRFFGVFGTTKIFEDLRKDERQKEETFLLRIFRSEEVTGDRRRAGDGWKKKLPFKKIALVLVIERR